MEKIKVYIASPYTNGWTSDNVRRQLEAQHTLMNYDFAAFAPLLSHFSEIYSHRPEHEWFAWDLEWLKVCHVLVRLRVFDGKNETTSKGADEEMERAREWGIPVFEFESLEQLDAWAKNINKEELFELYKIEQNEKINI